MSLNKKTSEVDSLSNRDDQFLLPTTWKQQPVPMYINGDITPSPGIYYTNLKTPDGSMFRR